MIQKIKKELLQFFKNPKEVIYFFTPIICALILIIPVPYTVTVGGGILNMDKKIIIDNSYKKEGSFNSAYVRELNGNVLTYLMAKVIPNYKLNKISDVIMENETEDDYNFREKMYFTSSTSSALNVAFKSLNYKLKVVNQKVYVMYIMKEAKTSLVSGDRIIKVAGIDISNMTEINKIINSINEDEFIITVERDNKIIDCLTSVVEINNEKKVGIYLGEEYSYETDPKVTFNFTDKEVGPSGGLIMSLSIYNKLVKEDITKGLKISGTGTIDNDGNVGEIGGIPYKLKGAVNKKSDIFLCPKDNYEEAIKEANDNNYNIDIYGVETFNEALDILNNLSKK